jgi:hypothetical protein
VDYPTVIGQSDSESRFKKNEDWIIELIELKLLEIKIISKSHKNYRATLTKRTEQCPNPIKSRFSKSAWLVGMISRSKLGLSGVSGKSGFPLAFRFKIARIRSMKIRNVRPSSGMYVTMKYSVRPATTLLLISQDIKLF